MKLSRTARLFPCLLLLTVLLPAAGCDWTDWLEASGSEARVSPVIGDLGVNPTSVFCGERNPVQVSFSYSDPQDDIFLVRVTARQEQSDTTVDFTIAWSDVDLASAPGRASGTFFFECGVPPVGVYAVTLQVEDERGHLSNELTFDVTLLSN
jgi:hypothetical protein